MNFDAFKIKISNLEKLQLPGVESHEKLAPSIRKKYLQNLNLDTSNSRDAAVMALFFPDLKNQTHLLLILRNTYQGVHSAQIGLPGGKVEPGDENLQETALRETEEEVGIPKESITVIKSLTKLYIPPSNFWVYPFIGILDATPTLIPQEDEVEEVLEINLDDFLDEKSLVIKNISTSYAERIETPAFILKEKIVWGATGMILSEIKDMLNQVL